MPSYPQSLNLAKILYRLMINPRGWRVDDLKENLGIKDRTYRKYRSLLQNHFDYLFDKEGKSGIVEVRDGSRRYLRIAHSGDRIEEQKGFINRMAILEMMRSVLGFLEDTDLGDDIDSICEEFKNRIGDKYFVRHLLRNMDRILFHIPDAPKDYSDQRDKISAILNALVFTRRLSMTHESARGVSGEYILEPLTLLLYRSGLYLIARYKSYKRPYTFALDRIKNLSLTEEKFDYPSSIEYSPSSYFEGIFGIFQEEGKKPVNVNLVFANVAWLKLYLKERRWHKSQRFKEMPDGRLKMTFTVRSMTEVWPWIRQFGKDVEVVEPKEERP